MLFWKETNKEGGGYDGKIFVNKQKIIPKTAWDNFQALLKDADFWNLEIKDEQTEKEGAENDGAQWILEGKTNDKYHVFKRWSTVSYDKFYKCCAFLISLTDFKIEPVDIY